MRRSGGSWEAHLRCHECRTTFTAEGCDIFVYTTTHYSGRARSFAVSVTPSMSNRYGSTLARPIKHSAICVGTESAA